MKKSTIAALAIASTLLAPPAWANLALAKKSNCLACHAVDKKLVGPAYRDIAKRYASDPGAEARLVEKVKKGGGGVWKDAGVTVPMPPNTTVKDADIKTLVRWILDGAK